MTGRWLALVGLLSLPTSAASVQDEPLEEVIVTAPVLTVPGPEFGEMPSGAFIAQLYNARRRGMELYAEERYAEALPYLVAAAKRGFKWAQASAGDVLYHGRGGVPRDLAAGIGWLGVAAEPKTTHEIDEYFTTLLRRLPASYAQKVDGIIRDYRVRYGSGRHRVDCRHAADEGRSMSLRLKALRCRFIDEVTQCRQYAVDGEGVIEEWLWICAPIKGSENVRAAF